MPQKQTGKGTRKYGRHDRAPSNRNQEYRTAKNKRIRQEKEATLQNHHKNHPTKRGAARAKRRRNMNFTKPADPKNDALILATKYPKFYEASKEAGILSGFSMLGELVSGKSKKG